MHRIDGPGATVDNKFTDGDPVAGIQATVVTDDWANDVQEELMSVLGAASIAPVKGTQDQVLKSIRALSTGLIGASRNLKMSIPTASASATLTADQIIVGASLTGQLYRLSAFNKSINLAATGAGGMDAGSAPASGFVAIYAIFNPVTGVSALLAKNASTVATEVYSGSNMPAGYTASALLSVWPTTAASLFAAAEQAGREISFVDVQILNTTVAHASATFFSFPTAVPLNAKKVRVRSSAAAGTAGVTLSTVVGATSTLVSASVSGVTSSGGGSGFVSELGEVPMPTPQGLYYVNTVGSGTISTTLFASRYTI